MPTCVSKHSVAQLKMEDCAEQKGMHLRYINLA